MSLTDARRKGLEEIVKKICGMFMGEEDLKAFAEKTMEKSHRVKDARKAIKAAEVKTKKARALLESADNDLRRYGLNLYWSINDRQDRDYQDDEDKSKFKVTLTGQNRLRVWADYQPYNGNKGEDQRLIYDEPLTAPELIKNICEQALADLKLASTEREAIEVVRNAGDMIKDAHK